MQVFWLIRDVFSPPAKDTPVIGQDAAENKTPTGKTGTTDNKASQMLSGSGYTSSVDGLTLERTTDNTQQAQVPNNETTTNPVDEQETKPQERYVEVKKGDTLWKIARDNGITVEALRAANGIVGDKIKVGDKLRIPSKAEVETVASEQDKSTTQVEPKTQTSDLPNANEPQKIVAQYKVVAGDTLDKIAKKYKISVQELLDANGMKPEDAKKLSIGRILNIPAPKPEEKVVDIVEPTDGEKSYANFKNALAASESSGRYDVMNRSGYLGRYQLGKNALVALGIYKLAPGEKQSKNYSGTFIKGNKYGIKSTKDILNDPKLQERLFDDYKKVQWKEIKALGLHKYIGKTVSYNNKTLVVSASGLLAGAHLCGTSALADFLKNGADRKDGNGVHIFTYVEKFNGYDVSKIIK